MHRKRPWISSRCVGKLKADPTGCNVMSDGVKTGVFKDLGEDSLVVMWRGKLIARYANTAMFIAAHVEALSALEVEQENILEDEYRDL